MPLVLGLSAPDVRDLHTRRAAEPRPIGGWCNPGWRTARRESSPGHNPIRAGRCSVMPGAMRATPTPGEAPNATPRPLPPALVIMLG